MYLDFALKNVTTLVGSNIQSIEKAIAKRLAENRP